MNPIRLEQINVFDVGPLGLVDIAAGLGVDKVSFWTAGAELLPGASLVTEDSKRAVRQRLDDLGVMADSIEAFMLSEEADVGNWRRAFDVGAYLGATTVAVINAVLAEPRRAAEALADFAAEADRFGLVTNLEPISMGCTRTLDEAQEIIRLSGSRTARIAVDVLHLVRTGGSPAAVAKLDPSLIGYAQICDGLSAAPEDLIHEAAFERLAPGEGQFPLEEFISTLPAHTVIGVEVPMLKRREMGMSAHERASIAVTGTRSVQAHVASSQAR